MHVRKPMAMLGVKPNILKRTFFSKHYYTSRDTRASGKLRGDWRNSNAKNNPCYVLYLPYLYCLFSTWSGTIEIYMEEKIYLKVDL